MSSLVAMSNAALSKVKANSILSLTEDSEEARACNSRYQDIIDSLLQSFPWNFATERTTLTPLTTSPEFEFDYQFLMPTNPYCLKVLSVYEGYTYKVEGRNILCDEASIQIKYTKRVTDVNQMTPLFRELFSLHLAADIAYKFAASSSLKAELLAEAGRLIRIARSMDAQEGTPTGFKTGSWIAVRGKGHKKFVVARNY